MLNSVLFSMLITYKYNPSLKTLDVFSQIIFLLYGFTHDSHLVPLLRVTELEMVGGNFESWSDNHSQYTICYSTYDVPTSK